MSAGRYVLGITRFSDLTLEEFKSQHLMPPASERSSHVARAAAAGSAPAPAMASIDTAVSPADATLPASAVDWRDPSLNSLQRSVITSVKDQANCGESCSSDASRH